MTEKDIYVAIGRRIKQVRIENKISQTELAARCNFETSNLCRLEAGKTNPTINTLLRVTSALNISLGKLMADL